VNQLDNEARQHNVQKSIIGQVLLEVLGVGAYFALVVVLYWQWLTDLGAVAVILGLLFLFKAVVDSGAISLSHLSPADPEFNIRTPAIEILKAISFFGVGVGAWIDLTKAMQIGWVPPYLPAAVIHLMLVCVFAICVVCCVARFTVALKNRPRQ
jgi:ABC-type antimicrobial peptide transport system permease subunit